MSKRKPVKKRTANKWSKRLRNLLLSRTRGKRMERLEPGRPI